MKALLMVLLTASVAFSQDTGKVNDGRLILSGPSSYTFTCYRRYSGFCQSSPLSEEDKKLDAAYEHIDMLFAQLGEEPMAYITINEYQQVMYLSEKIIWFSRAEQIYSAEKDLESILGKIQLRKTTNLGWSKSNVTKP